MKFPAEVDTRIYSETPSCLLGSLVVEDPTTHELSCIPYTPSLNHAGCKEWPSGTVASPADQHKAIVNALAMATGTTIQRVAGLTAPEHKRHIVVNARGQLVLVSQSAGANLDVPGEEVEVGFKAASLDLLVDVSPLVVQLTEGEDSCLSQQTQAELSAAAPNLTIRGYVFNAMLGFANKLTLTDVSVDSKVGTVVGLKAKSFTIATKSHGLIDKSYEDALRKLLEKLDGVDAAVNGVKISQYSDKVTQLATTFVTLRRFPGLPIPPPPAKKAATAKTALNPASPRSR